MSSTYNVTGNELTSADFLLLTITNDEGLHGDVTLEGGDDVGGLLFLVPSDNSVQHKDTNDNTEIDPITKTSSEEDSNFHN